MEQIDLAVELRTESGKTVARNLRRNKMVPANLHGINKKEAMSLKLNTKEFLQAVHTEAGEQVIFNLVIAGAKKKTPETAIVKEVQYDKINGFVQHVDFVQISLKEKITVAVPVHLTGHAIGVKDGGVLDQILHELQIEALPTDIPEHIAIDVTSLKIGDSVLVGAVAQDKSFNILNNDDELIVVISHQASVAEGEGAGEESAEGASIEPEVASRGKEKDAEGS